MIKTAGRHMRRMTILSAVIALLSMAVVVPAANAAPGDAAVLKGTWVGTYSGYSNSGYKSGLEKIVITSVKGSNARGTWQSRSSATVKWSKPQPVNLSVYAQENDDSLPTDYISGADADGIYVGKLVTSKNRLVFTYSAPEKDLLVLTLDLQKR